jgi:1-aminocyclopropane-1-carboxylate deaminase/D-cysteine desulfhydrase-like pyridoxal-dependent ACC family enzyme
LLAQIARASGILLDPVYTIKGALGLLTSLQEHPEMFRGRKVVFVHTGGIHGLYDGRITAHMGGKEHPTIAARAESK